MDLAGFIKRLEAEVPWLSPPPLPTPQRIAFELKRHGLCEDIDRDGEGLSFRLMSSFFLEPWVLFLMLPK